MRDTVVVPLVLGLAWACAPVGEPAPERAGARVASAQSDAPVASQPRADAAFLVGVLAQTGVPHCAGGGEPEWLAVDHVVGWTTVTAPADDLEALLGQPVIAIGSVGGTSSVKPVAQAIEECPPMQMRSDWVSTPLGIRLRREPDIDLAHFTADTLEPFGELAASLSGDTLVVELRNPVPAALAGVKLRVHYEGCHGKPGTALREHDVGELAVGAGTRAIFPAIVQAERAPGRLEPHRAASVQVLATGERIYFDLDVPLSTLNAGVDCPERGG